MTSPSVTIVTLAIALTTTNSLVLFTGFPLHRVEIWWPLGGLEHLDIHPSHRYPCAQPRFLLSVRKFTDVTWQKRTIPACKPVLDDMS